jgi:hypothetical protein
MSSENHSNTTLKRTLERYENSDTNARTQVQALSKYPALVAVVRSHAAGGPVDVSMSSCNKRNRKYIVTKQKYFFPKYSTILAPPKPILIGTVRTFNILLIRNHSNTNTRTQVPRSSNASLPSKAFAFHHVSRVPCAPTWKRTGPNTLMLDVDNDILIERQALLKINFDGVDSDEKRVQSEVSYLKSLSKRMHASGLGAEIEIYEYERKRT